MSNKKQLLNQIEELEADYQSLVRDYDRKCLEVYEKTTGTIQKQRKYAMTFSLDLWPLKDWFRLSVSPFQPGRYFQLCIGPFRIDFFED